jgi:hypothetical protein
MGVELSAELSREAIICMIETEVTGMKGMICVNDDDGDITNDQ